MKTYNRRSIRLKGYDYSQNGYYFVTICVQDREEVFGVIGKGEMKFNEVGEMIDSWWNKIPQKFYSRQIDDYVVMPNHIHGIIVIVGADPCVCPENYDTAITKGEHMGSPLHKTIQWFKTMTTNDYLRKVKQNNWPRFNKRLWQRNYYEHIIRNERDYWAIKQYIQDNLRTWEKDELFIK